MNMNIITIIVVVAALVSIAIGFYVYRTSKRAAVVAASEAVTTTLTRGWPHPWVGRVVAYADCPSQPIGKVTRVDGSGRARVARPGTTHVRRSMSRLVLYKAHDYDRPAGADSTGYASVN